MPSSLSGLSVLADRRLVRAAARSTRYARVTIVAPEAPRAASRTPVNVALVLDRSGSMEGDKIRLARQAAVQAIQLLRAEDRFAVVAYDDRIEVVMESTPATAGAKRQAMEALERIDARGSTDLCGGWLRGCEQVAAFATRGFVNRALLLTDGLANQGITEPDAILRHAAALFERGVQTSTFGVGADFDERLLQYMADAGGGHFYFIANATQIPDLLASELGEALEVTVHGAALEARLAPGMTAEPLNQFRDRRADATLASGAERTVRIELGDLVSSQEVAVVLTLGFPSGDVGETIGVDLALVDRDGAQAAPTARLAFTFDAHPANDRQPREREVDRQVATLHAARARAEATEHNRLGDYEKARAVITATARKIRSYAGTDVELNRIADELLRDLEQYAERPMTPMMLKVSAAASYSALRERMPSGQAKRR